MNDKPRLVTGRYRLDEEIGRGGMGNVYKATDIETGETVAIKRLHASILEENPDIIDRFLREGEVLRQLDHPSIVTIHDAIEEDGQHYLIMEHVSGGSLRDLIDAQGRLPLENVLNIALDLADALSRAHRLNIVHRDIKPDNVLLAEDGTPRLTDFGVAHLGDRTRLTQTGSVIGTYAYLSPEACNGLDLDARTDIWSFGVMLFEMLAGRVPFQEQSTAAILNAILSKPAPDLGRLRPDLPEPLVDLIHRMLEKDRGRRISSIRLVGAELEALIHDLDAPLRSLLLKGQNVQEGSSRFATPSDERTGNDIPAMARGDAGQTHGLSLYPASVTPGGTPITGEYAPATKWKWIAFMVMAIALGCSAVLIAAILSGNLQRDSEATRESLLVRPPAGGPQDAPPPDVEPPEAGHYLVLVANLEDLSGTGQMVGMPQPDAMRFLVGNLEETLEETMPSSNISVSYYPALITSDREARTIAEQYGATVIVWGNFTEELVAIEVQVGVLDAFPNNRFERNMLERTANVRLHLSDVRRESLAPHVLNVLNILFNADGNAFETMRSAAILDAIVETAPPADVTGSGVAALIHRHMLAGDPAEAEALLDSAIDRDTGNALLYAYRAIAGLRLGDLDGAAFDMQTAARLGPDTWTTPAYFNMAGTGPNNATASANRVIQLRPDDWYAYFMRGIILFADAGNIAQAKADFERSIALDPPANLPYVPTMLIALHEGRIAEAQALAHTILTRFPDPELTNRAFMSLYGSESDNLLVGVYFSAVTDTILGQHASAIDALTPWLSALFEKPAIPGLLGEGDVMLSDLFFTYGMAHCNLHHYEEAEAAFGQAIKFNRDVPLFYLLRGQVRLNLLDKTGAEADFETARAHTLDPAFDRWAEAAIAGDMTCENLFDATPAE